MFGGIKVISKTFRDSIRICILGSLFIFGSIFVISCKTTDYQAKVLDEARIWKAKIESDIQVAVVDEIRKVASSLEEMKHSVSPSREDANNLIKQTLENHEDYLAVWTRWEPNAFDNQDSEYQNVIGHDKSGQFIPYWNRLNGKINLIPIDNYSDKAQDSFYQQLINSGKEMASDPVECIVNNKKQLKVIYAVPIYYQKKIIGAAGIDLPLLKFFKPIIRQVRVLDVAYGFLIANNGIVTAHPTKWSNVGRSIELFGFDPGVIQAVKDGREAFQLKISKISGREHFYQFVPIQIGASDRPWSLAISLVPDWLNGRGPKVTW